jgi:hypothetical protein
MMPSWAWDAGTRAGEHPESLGDGQECFELTQRLLALRADSPALRRGHYTELWRQGGGAPVYAFLRGSGDDRVIVIVNAGTSPSGSVPIPLRNNPGLSPDDRLAFTEGRRASDELGLGAPAEIEVHEGHLVIELPALTAGIYRF